MIRLVKLALQAAIVELEKRYPEPAPVAIVASDEKSAPWNMVQEVVPAPKRRRRKVAAS